MSAIKLLPVSPVRCISARLLWRCKNVYRVIKSSSRPQASVFMRAAADGVVIDCEVGRGFLVGA